ncbi:MAG: hypothetical protein JSU68_03845 [Phycisphaerales bacterium]|nr:MAG: hypothetical protein JSU68_03845 [Phycisphaerales bacterium]
MQSPPSSASQSASAAPRARSATHPVLWIIAVLLGVIALELALLGRGPWSASDVWAQLDPRSDSRGVFAFTGQLDKNTFGLFMLDIDAGTIWCYEITGKPPDRRLKLAAARLWLYDRYLEDFNIDGLTPDQVAAYVEEERRLRESGEQAGPTDAVSGESGVDREVPEQSPR